MHSIGHRSFGAAALDTFEKWTFLPNCHFAKELDAFDIPSGGVDRDSGGESGHGARAGRETETKCLARPAHVPIHPV